MEEFVSEPITPLPGTFDARAMGTGLPGLPQGFTWRGRANSIVAVLATWKHTAPAGGQVYLRRHCFRLRMNDDSIWTVYFLRQTPRSGSPKIRWFMEKRELA